MTEYPELWSHEYFLDLMNRHMKHEIAMFFHVHHERKPTAEEYKEHFNKYLSQMTCEVTNYDLGIYEDF